MLKSGINSEEERGGAGDVEDVWYTRERAVEEDIEAAAVVVGNDGVEEEDGDASNGKCNDDEGGCDKFDETEWCDMDNDEAIDDNGTDCCWNGVWSESVKGNETTEGVVETAGDTMGEEIMGGRLKRLPLLLNVSIFKKILFELEVVGAEEDEARDILLFLRFMLRDRVFDFSVDGEEGDEFEVWSMESNVELTT